MSSHPFPSYNLLGSEIWEQAEIDGAKKKEKVEDERI